MKLAATMRNAPLAVLLSLPLAASAAEYMEKTPFQLSRAFSPGVVTEGGRIVWVAGQTATRDSQGADIANNFEAQVKQVFSRSEEHTSELQSPCNLVCRLLLEKKKKTTQKITTIIKFFQGCTEH